MATHGRLTYASYKRSFIGYDITLAKDFGIQDINTFGLVYYDTKSGLIREREINDFEQSKRRFPEEVDPISISGWFLRGAIREDDVPWPFGENPQDDPDGQIFRVLRHFYDPVNDRGLRILWKDFTPATDWATGSVDTFDMPNVVDIDRRNHFTILDAREAQWRALTGQDRYGSTAIGPGGTDADESVRKAYWATTFRALGDVLHLIQDMAQPQHTRNDLHNTDYGHGETVYEKYTNARVLGQGLTCVNGNSRTPPAIDYGDYPIPRFTRYSDIFSTEPGGDVMAGLGLADYSNRGFFSAGTNLGNTAYVHPVGDPELYERERLSMTDPCLPVGAETDILRGTVPDHMHVPDYHVALSSRGLWDVSTWEDPVAEEIRYTLGETAYDEMADLLIPRAVAYGAGFLNYFFRGRLEVQVENFSGSDVSVRFRNVSTEDTVFSDNGDSQLIATYRYREGQDWGFGTAEASVNLAAGDDVAPGATSANTYTFTFDPAIPDSAAEIELRLVYRGRLGNEADAIAVGMSEVTSPGFIFFPSPEAADGLTTLRLLHKEDGEWRMPAGEYEADGNIDWKGWYVDGKPTRVLTWYGTPSRYFPPGNNSSSVFDTEIYQNGVLYAIAPNRVLGAALMREDDGSEWLIAICSDGATDVVYRKPNVQDISDALYDPDTAPNGWQVMGMFPGIDGYLPDVPWFFNGDGTEAQTIRGYNSDDLTRLKITLSGGSAQRQNLGNLEKPIQEHEESWRVSCSGEVEMPSTCGGGFKRCGYTKEVKYHHIDEIQSPARKYVVAVDYLDNQELLLYAFVEGYWTNEEISRSYTKINYLYYPDGRSRGKRKEEDEKYTHTVTRDDEIVLSLQGNELHYKYKNARAYSFNFDAEYAGESYNDEPDPPPERDFAHSTQNEHELRHEMWFISYADLRAGVVISRDTIETIEGEGSGDTLSTEQHSYYSYSNVDYIEDTIIKHGDKHIPTEKNNHGYTTAGEVYPTISFGENIQRCRSDAFEVDDSTGVNSSNIRFWDSLAYEVTRPIGAAVDRSGHLLLSFLYNNNTYSPVNTSLESNRRLNYLTGGDLIQFAVGATDELSFDPVSVY
ncbi:hypothetical protein TspCOW1_08800 [Thiohalobacter sp. COW1]|nr:hypothetical protein TspCOW1_08800 [Thiohalobacter sp. COW1]